MTVMVPPHPLTAENLVAFSLNGYKRRNFVSESGRQWLPLRFPDYLEGLDLYLAKRECDIKHHSFFLGGGGGVYRLTWIYSLEIYTLQFCNLELFLAIFFHKS